MHGFSFPPFLSIQLKSSFIIYFNRSSNYRRGPSVQDSEGHRHRRGSAAIETLSSADSASGSTKKTIFSRRGPHRPARSSSRRSSRSCVRSSATLFGGRSSWAVAASTRLAATTRLAASTRSGASALLAASSRLRRSSWIRPSLSWTSFGRQSASPQYHLPRSRLGSPRRDRSSLRQPWPRLRTTAGLDWQGCAVVY